MRRPDIARRWQWPRGQFRSVACALGTATLAACAPAARFDADPHPVAGRVVVHNYTTDPLTVYLTGHGTVYRLGTVGALGEGSFLVPAEAPELGEYFLTARRTGGRMLASERFPLTRSSTVEWTVEGRATTSSVARMRQRRAA
jgi:hypothetical protein